MALDRARSLETLSWELRVAISLAKLWHRDGKAAKAKALLSFVYDRFTEGFETADLKAARVLIDALSALAEDQGEAAGGAPDSRRSVEGIAGSVSRW